MENGAKKCCYEKCYQFEARHLCECVCPSLEETQLVYSMVSRTQEIWLLYVQRFNYLNNRKLFFTAIVVALNFLKALFRGTSRPQRNSTFLISLLC